MKKNDLLFVYGTLRQGERSDLRKQLYNYGVSFISMDKISAQMYHLGGFPGVKEAIDWNPDAPSVVGEVFSIRDSSIIAILDAYECYDHDNPERGMYTRYQVITKKGRKVWIYVYNYPVKVEQLIESGDWKNRGWAG